MSFEHLARTFPLVYPKWKKCFDAGTKSYEGFPLDSCSVDGHEMALRFKAFIEFGLAGRGKILDVGCGPQPTPSYLEGINPDRITGLDPLPARHPFESHPGFAEQMPWDDYTFDAVIAATSLDHVLDLPTALSEIVRVLRPGGMFLVWVSFVPGAQPPKPEDPPVDAFHLFHFDQPWFEELMAKRFKLIDGRHHPGSSFYTYRKSWERAHGDR